MPGVVGYIPEYPKRQQRGIADLFGPAPVPRRSYDSPFPDIWQRAWKESRGSMASAGKGDASWPVLLIAAAAIVLLLRSDG